MCLVLLVASCVGVDGRRGATADVLVDLPGPGVTRVPCEILGPSTFGYNPNGDSETTVARFVEGANSVVDDVGAFAGTCGSPVYDGMGDFIGTVVKSMNGTDSPVFGLRDAHFLKRVWAGGRSARAAWLASENFESIALSKSAAAGKAV